MKLIIEGVPPYDGQYDMDLAFTNREMHRIKILSEGLRGGEVFEALVEYDTAAYVAVTAVVLERSGIIVDTELLWAAQSGAIVIDASTNGEVPLAAESSSVEPDAASESATISGEPSTPAGG